MIPVSSGTTRWAALLLTISLLTPPMLHATTAQITFEDVVCENGSKTAFRVIVIDADVGCVLEIYGRDCDGVFWRQYPNGRIVASEPDMSYTWYRDGTSSNGNWYVKGVVNNGVLTALWGRNTQGQYYVLDLGN